MDDLPALCRDERIDAGEQAPGTWDVRVFQPCHHVQLALEKTEVTGEPPHPLLAPALRLPLLVKVVRRKEQPIQDVYGIAEGGVLFVGPARRQRSTLKVLGLIVQAAECGVGARERRIDVRRALEIFRSGE